MKEKVLMLAKQISDLGTCVPYVPFRTCLPYASFRTCTLRVLQNMCILCALQNICTLHALPQDKWRWNCLVLCTTRIRAMKIVPWALML